MMGISELIDYNQLTLKIAIFIGLVCEENMILHYFNKLKTYFKVF